ncbi:hypothetical protein B0H66DRAFT_275204 [Apodospora peruviana]|uniref:Secreted protein n=1 Tax=Apodospora peruviana TaxID=516989 RepID=A0AAE0HZY0_9PEZI|nr:hypothetical protein B0H66DRAFT_275204 [Apodospora peruviana]
MPGSTFSDCAFVVALAYILITVDRQSSIPACTNCRQTPVPLVPRNSPAHLDFGHCARIRFAFHPTFAITSFRRPGIEKRGAEPTCRQTRLISSWKFGEIQKQRVPHPGAPPQLPRLPPRPGSSICFCGLCFFASLNGSAIGAVAGLLMR